VETGSTVYADIDLLSIVIHNLLLNAIKFTPKEGHIIVSSIEKDGIVEASVRDDGIGIDPDKISNLFNFDTIFTTEGTIGERGTGLGLPLCKEFIERNGGKISVESEPGKGSKFTFTVPKPIS
jgi:signal transduction histidine kinase